MRRTKTNRTENTKPVRSLRILTQKDDRFVLLEQRGSRHGRALSRLEKKFGRADFSQTDARRTGVDLRLLKDLVRFNQVQKRDGDSYVINRKVSSHAAEIEIPIHHLRAESALYANLPPDSSLLKKKAEITAHRLPPEEEPLAMVPRDIVKRFRLPYSLYLAIRPEVENFSAYVRYLIYADRGMEQEAQLEKEQIGYSTRAD